MNPILVREILMVCLLALTIACLAAIGSGATGHYSWLLGVALLLASSWLASGLGWWLYERAALKRSQCSMDAALAIWRAVTWLPWKLLP